MVELTQSGNGDVIDVESFDVSGSAYASTYRDHEGLRGGRTASPMAYPGGSPDDAARLVGVNPPPAGMDQAMTVAEGNETAADLRARAAARDREATGTDRRPVIHEVRRALPPGRSH